jgi:hypothetical protein
MGDAAKRIEALLTAREQSGTDSGSVPTDELKDESAAKPVSGQETEAARAGDELAPEGGDGDEVTPEEDLEPTGDPKLPTGVALNPDTGELTIDPKTFVRKLKVDGQEVETTLDEMEKSFSFQAHNTRTAQKNAEERRSLETEKTAVREDRERYAKILPELESIIAAHADPYANVDWERLRADDPKAFAEHRAAYDLHRERLAKVKAERERIEQEQFEELRVADAAHAEEQHGVLMKAVPEWTDETKRTAELTEIAAWAKQQFGLGDEDLGQVNAAWHYVALRKAFLYDKLQQTADRAKQKVGSVRETAAPPARAAKPKTKTAVQRSLDTLRQTGKVRDAAAVLEARLNARQETT